MLTLVLLSGSCLALPDTDLAEAAYAQGIKELRARDADAAMSAFTRAIEAEPAFAPAHYRLGLLHRSRSRWLPAIESLRAAVEFDPDHADAHCELGEAYLIGTASSSAALDPLQRAAELEPNHPRARRLLGLALLRLHRLPDAEENLRRAVEADPGDVAARYLLGLTQYQDERHSPAVQTLSTLVQRWPWHAQAHATLGNAQLRAGQVAAGRASLRTFEDLHRAAERTETLELATQADPTSADAWLRLAQQFVTRSDWNRAAGALRTYTRLRPADERGRELLGYAYLQADDYESALDVYGALVEQFPGAAEHHNSVGVVYMLLGEYPPAIDHLLTAIRLDDTGRQYLLNLERAYRRAGDSQAADDIAERHRAVRPGAEAPR